MAGPDLYSQLSPMMGGYGSAQDMMFRPFQPRQPNSLGQMFGQLFGPVGGLVGPALEPQLRQLTGAFTFANDPNRNAWSQYSDRIYYEQLARMRGQAAKADQGLINDGLRGMLATFAPDQVIGYDANGVARFNPGMEASLGRMAGVGSQLLPVLAAVAPDQVDRFGGSLGLRSAGAVGFASGARFMTGSSGVMGSVRADPGDVMNGVLDGLYAGRDSSQTGGLGAGRVGQLFSELSQRGMIGGDNVEQTTARAREQIRKYSKALGAVRDFFGDNGMGDAPMAELIKAMGAITGGRIGGMDTDAATQQIQRFAAVARTNGVGFAQQAVMFGQQAAQAMGVRQAVFGDIATFSAGRLAGYAASGLKDNTGVETLGSDEFVLQQQGQLARAAASPMANLAGAVIESAKYAKDGSQLKDLADALKRGDRGAFERLSRADALADVERAARASGLAAGTLTRQTYQGLTQNALNLTADVAAGIQRTGQAADFERSLGGVASKYGRTGKELADALRAAAGTSRDQAEMVKKAAAALGIADAAGLGADLSAVSTLNNDGATGDEARANTVFNQARGQNADVARGAAGREAQLTAEAVVQQALTGLNRDTPAARLIREGIKAGTKDGKFTGDMKDILLRAIRVAGGAVDQRELEKALGQLDQTQLDAIRESYIGDKAAAPGNAARAVVGGAAGAVMAGLADPPKAAADAKPAGGGGDITGTLTIIDGDQKKTAKLNGVQAAPVAANPGLNRGP